MAKQLEPGYNGRLISLGGVVGKRGVGRQSIRNNINLAASVGQIGLPANSRRIAATIQSYTVGDDLQIFLGNSTDGACYIISSRDVFQINYLLPWTGAVYMYSTGILAVVCNEIVVSSE